ncbi:MAG: DUF1559 domain-containing protein [Planctomycetaceae bacterium]
MRTAFRGITRWEIVIAGALMVLLWGLLLPMANSDVREQRRLRPRCANHLRMIGLALHNYCNAYGTLPPAISGDGDGPGTSWRALISSYLPGGGLDGYRFDEAWNSPHNRGLLSEAARNGCHVHFCPEATMPPTTRTNYVAVIGRNTAWHGSEPVAMADITDRKDQTILVVEIVNSDIEWFEPRDLEWDRMLFNVNSPYRFAIGSRHSVEGEWVSGERAYVNVLLADGTVHRLPADTPPDIVKALLTIDGGEVIDSPW